MLQKITSKNAHKYAVCSIVLMLALTAILSGCAASNDVPKPIVEETKETTIQPTDDAQAEKTEELIRQIVNQVMNGDLSTDTITELEDIGIDSEMLAAFKETVVSIDG